MMGKITLKINRAKLKVRVKVKKEMPKIPKIHLNKNLLGKNRLKPVL